MKRNWIKKIIGGISVTSALFVFQACYGTPQDFGLDVYVEGVVKSKDDGAVIAGIKVADVKNNQYEYTDENGKFGFYVEKTDSILLRFSDTIQNKLYFEKDTLLTFAADSIYLDIALDKIK